MAEIAAASKEIEEQLRVHSTIVHDAHEFAFSMCLKCVVDLGIPDVISSHGGTITLSDLLSELFIPCSNASYIRRILRVLVHRGYFVHDKKSDTYSLTPLSAALTQDSPTSLAIFVLGLLDSNMIVSWNNLSTFCRMEKQAEGSAVFELEHGKSLWDLGREHPEFSQLFNEAMDSDTRSTMKAMLAACGEIFRGVRTLVDVGGGDGTTLNAIAEAFPHIKCTVYDQPHVVANVPEGSLVQAIGGNMFDHIPQADVVLFKLIMHDWTDQECVKILKLCKEAIPSREEGGKVVILDIVMKNAAAADIDQETSTTEAQLYFDIAVMVQVGGKEREEHEWKKLFTDAGFTDYKITPLGLRSLIEVFP